MQNQYSGFWARFVASFIDGIIVSLLGAGVYLLVRSPYPGGILVGILYSPFFESSGLQATPGKALLGMQVTDLQGQRITFKAAFIRYLMKFVSSALLLIGYVIQPFTEKRQALHDIVAKTLVVNGAVPKINYFQAWYNQFLEVLGMTDKVPRDQPKAQASPADLAGLYDLYQKGILTEVEYNQKREEILKRL